jgi:hypothetical protein
VSALLPDVEVLLVNWLKAQPAISAIVADRVSTSLPANPVLPALTLFRVSGGPGMPWEDRARVQVDCWGTSRGATSVLARTVISALDRLQSTSGLAAAEAIDGPTPRFDPSVPSRHQLDALVLVYPPQ